MTTVIQSVEQHTPRGTLRANRATHLSHYICLYTQHCMVCREDSLAGWKLHRGFAHLAHIANWFKMKKNVNKKTEKIANECSTFVFYNMAIFQSKLKQETHFNKTVVTNVGTLGVPKCILIACWIHLNITERELLQRKKKAVILSEFAICTYLSSLM